MAAYVFFEGMNASVKNPCRHMKKAKVMNMKRDIIIRRAMTVYENRFRLDVRGRAKGPRREAMTHWLGDNGGGSNGDPRFRLGVISIHT